MPSGSWYSRRETESTQVNKIISDGDKYQGENGIGTRIRQRLGGDSGMESLKVGRPCDDEQEPLQREDPGLASILKQRWTWGYQRARERGPKVGPQ